jgi:hypothetical protein
VNEAGIALASPQKKRLLQPTQGWWAAIRSGQIPASTLRTAFIILGAFL